jgi:hypothetical protein
MAAAACLKQTTPKIRASLRGKDTDTAGFG